MQPAEVPIVRRIVPVPVRRDCRTCHAAIEELIDFGPMPLAGAFLSPKPGEPLEESLYPMTVCFCPACGLVQIPQVIPKEQFFHADYHYFSSTTQTLNAHFTAHASFLAGLLEGRNDPVVVEVGCNDGILLRQLKRLGVRAVGIDASANVVDAARLEGLDARCAFFAMPEAEVLRGEGIRADIVTGSNVFAHNDDIDEVFRAVRTLVRDDGFFVLEVHSLLSLVRGLQFDFFYHEHFNYYSLHSLAALLGRFGFEVADAVETSLHSGTLRVVARVGRDGGMSPSARALWRAEEDAGIVDLGGMREFASRVGTIRERLRGALEERAAKGRRICGYGASGRSVTLLNSLGLSPGTVSFMVDASPARAGYLLPGLGIPIHFPEPERLAAADTLLLTAWSYAEEILRKERAWLAPGREFLLPLPEIRSVEVPEGGGA